MASRGRGEPKSPQKEESTRRTGDVLIEGDVGMTEAAAATVSMIGKRRAAAQHNLRIPTIPAAP